ncbi:hypothetical protein [Peribacillus simplex]|uniref:hypothetical protein n=1 Tax=Peribacillus simplex TaxID=1478 RepID=UPI003D0204FC
MNIFEEAYTEPDINMDKKKAKYFNEMFNVPVLVFEENKNQYFIAPIPSKNSNRLRHLLMEEVFRIEIRHS